MATQQHGLNHKQPVPMSLDTSSFVDIIKIYIPLKSRGSGNPSGYCPFCNGAERWFTIFPEQMTWECLSCGERGDIYRLFQKMRRISHDEAVRFVDILQADLFKKNSNKVKALSARSSKQNTSPEASQKNLGYQLKNDPNPVQIKNGLSEEPASYHQAQVIPPEGMINPETTEVLRVEDDQLGHAIIPSTEDVNSVPIFQMGPTANDINELADLLVNKFKGVPGCQGVAVIDPKADVERALRSSIEELSDKDTWIIAQYMRETNARSKAAIGDFKDNDGDTYIAMLFALKMTEYKLLWIPLSWQGEVVDILFLLEPSKGESIYLMQLRNFMRSLAA